MMIFLSRIFDSIFYSLAFSFSGSLAKVGPSVLICPLVCDDPVKKCENAGSILRLLSSERKSVEGKGEGLCDPAHPSATIL